ncbi:MAG: hypothetical protein KDB14_08135 [Planctomycetales bacterium]|nr:hypothetical protein [Planctomycetales bacterium]
MPASSSDGGARWLSAGIVVATMLAAAIAVSPNSADPDLWGHVQYGNDLLNDGLPRTTTYSYTAEGHRWINHENLAELAMALLARLGGWSLMTGKCLLGLTALWLIIRSSRRQGAGLMVSCGLTLLIAVNLSYHWSIRPQLASFFGFAVMLGLLEHAFDGWSGQWQLSAERDTLKYSLTRLKRLWWAVPLFCVWANSHGGFVAGLCIFIAYLGLRAIEAMYQRGAAATGLVARLALMALAVVLATLINPYGVKLHLWLLESLGQPRPEINEWHPPNFFNSLALPLWLLMGVLACSLTLTRQRHDFTHLVILLITLWQALEHQRHIPFLALAIGFWLPRHIQSWLSRWGLSEDEREAAPMPTWIAGAMAGGLLLALGLLGMRLYDRLQVVRVERDEFPVGAVQYMADRQLGGNLVVTFNWAQYLIGAFGAPDAEPRVRVAFDGRFRTCYPQELVDAHFDFVLGNVKDRHVASDHQFDEARALYYRQPLGQAADLVLINRFQPHGQLVMLRQGSAWTLLYQDGTAQLWGRSDRYNDPGKATYVAPEQRSIRIDPVGRRTKEQGHVAWPAYAGTASSREAAKSRQGQMQGRADEANL